MIKIFKFNNKYHFKIKNFSSFSHSYLTKFSDREYRFAWEAYKDAKNIVKNHHYHVKCLDKLAFEENQRPVVSDISASTKIADHYENILDFLCDVATGLNEEAKSKYEKKLKKIHYLEIKAVIKEILFVKDNVENDEYSEDSDKKETLSRLNNVIKKLKKLVNKHYKNQLNDDIIENKKKKGESFNQSPLDMSFGEGADDNPPIPTANSIKNMIKLSQIKDKKSSLKDDVIDHYGEKCCYAIENLHPEILWKKSNKGINLIEGNNTVLEININDDFLIEDIYPGKSIIDMYSYESNNFYEKYWKPIIEEIGHFCSFDDSLICLLEGKSLPEKSNKDLKNSFNFYDKNNNHIGKLSFVFNNNTWLIKKIDNKKINKQSNNIEENGLVICVNKNLPTYHNKTGRVIQVINSGYETEYDINFGNTICRMTKQDIDEIQIN